jgi:hypothetical protein
MSGSPTTRGATLGRLRRRVLPILVEIVINILAPLVVYDHTVARLGEVGALMASSAPPLAWSLIEFARHRRVDAISILVLLGIGLSLAMYLGGGSAHLLQLREKLVTAIIGTVFLVSALIGRPLIYELARASMRRDPNQSAALAEFEARANDRGFKPVMRNLTVIWGVGLLAEAGMAVWLVLHLSVHDYLIYGPVAGYGFMGLLILITFLHVRRAQARGRARRAREEAAAAQPSPDRGT